MSTHEAPGLRITFVAVRYKHGVNYRCTVQRTRRATMRYELNDLDDLFCQIEGMFPQYRFDIQYPLPEVQGP